MELKTLRPFSEQDWAGAPSNPKIQRNQEIAQKLLLKIMFIIIEVINIKMKVLTRITYMLLHVLF